MLSKCGLHIISVLLVHCSCIKSLLAAAWVIICSSELFRVAQLPKAFPQEAAVRRQRLPFFNQWAYAASVTSVGRFVFFEQIVPLTLRFSLTAERCPSAPLQVRSLSVELFGLHQQLNRDKHSMLQHMRTFTHCKHTAETQRTHARTHCTLPSHSTWTVHDDTNAST